MASFFIEIKKGDGLIWQRQLGQMNGQMETDGMAQPHKRNRLVMGMVQQEKVDEIFY